MPVVQWAWKRAILLTPFHTSLSSCVLVYSSFWQERCGTATRRRWTFRKCQGWTLTSNRLKVGVERHEKEDIRVTLPTKQYMETNKEEILYQFLTGLFRLVRWFWGKKRVSNHSWANVLLYYPVWTFVSTTPCKNQGGFLPFTKNISTFQLFVCFILGLIEV